MAQFLDYTGLGHFKDKNDALYAKQDGSYEGMTVGNAEQLVSTVGVSDSAPYTFRTTGGSADVGDRLNLKAVVGGTVAWNQLVKDADINFTSSSTDTRALYFCLRKSSSPYTTILQKQNVQVGVLASIVASTFDGYAEMIHSGSQRNIRITSVDGFQLVNGHKYYFTVNFTGVDTSTSGGLTAKDIQVYDLTTTFGSTIADYAYTLESGTADAGIAWLKKYGYFTKPYYPNAAASLQSVKTSAHKTIGFNQWDEESESGYYDVENNGAKASSANWARCKNPIPCVPNTTYYFYSNYAGSDNFGALVYYDASGNQIGYKTSGVKNATFTTPNNCYYVTFYAKPSWFNSNICINIHWDGERDGEYAPFEQHTYALDDVELRGIPKLDASNNLYYDGDQYTPDGTVTRNAYEETLTVSSIYTLNYASYDFAICQLSYGYYGLNSATANVIGEKVVANTQQKGYTSADIPIGTVLAYSLEARQIAIAVAKGTTKAQAESVYNGSKICYRINTPFTESADPYTELQICDDFWVEEFVDAATRDFDMPVGHNTVYQPNLRAKLEMAPDSPDGDGDYIVRQTNGTNAYIPLVEVKELPDMPSEDGNYTLRCTVTDGTATLSWVSA